MMPSNSKSARSRFSSPLHLSGSPSSHNKGVSTEGQRKFLQRWLEPPLQNKASFQEAGLMRGGVVENMAPLGTLPKQAKKQTPGGSEGTPVPTPGPAVKKIILKNAAARATPVEEDLISEPIATIESPGKEAISPTRPIFPINGIDDEDDGDYMPIPKKSTKSRRSSPGQGAHAGGGAGRPVRFGRRSTAAARQKSSSPSPLAAQQQQQQQREAPTAEEQSHPSSFTSFPTPPPQSMSIADSLPPVERQPQQPGLLEPKLEPDPESELDLGLGPKSFTMPEFKAPPSVQRLPDNKEVVDKIVETAVDEALKHYRYPTAYALRMLYDDYHEDPHFVSMFEDVFHQRADIDALAEFNRLISARKRDGKNGNRAFQYYVPPPANTRHFTPQKAKPAPYSALLTMDITPAKGKNKASDFDQHVHKKQKLDDEYNINPGAFPTATHASAPSTYRASAESMTPTPTPAPAPSIVLKPEPAPAQSDPAGVLPPAVVQATPAMAQAVAAAAPNQVSCVNETNGNTVIKSLNGVNGSKVQKSPHKSLHKSPHKSPEKLRKRQRSRSVSSDSSLSSVPDDALMDYDDFMDQVDEKLGVSRPSTAEPNDAPTPASSVQPINIRQKRPASKKQNQSPELDPSPDTTATTQPSLPSRDTDMPAAVAVNGASHQRNQKSSVQGKLKSKSSGPDEPRSLIEKKLIARDGTLHLYKNKVADSFTRDPRLTLDPFEDELPALLPIEQLRSTRTPAPPRSLRAARAAKRNNEHTDEASSPTTAFRADLEPPSSARSSRAATPANPRTTKKQRVGPRVKTSPMKKKGTSAGIPRGSGERPSPVVSGPQHDKDENDDSCYTCGGSGELVCCDGCHYSFHFLCIDPPMDEGSMPDDWYCYECSHKYFPEKFAGHRGAFGTLLDALDRKNPRAFQLPQEIRDFFEGVKTGQYGEYDETTSTKPKPVKKGVEEPFDFFKVRNSEGNAVLCHCCHQGVTASRPIIPCSLCGLNWHLDCLDPPLAVPPVLRNWRCPCHVDDAFMKNLAPAHKYRKIKNAPVIEQAYSRGMRNNGWIEIEEDDDDDDDDDEEEGEGTWTATRRDFGRVYRLPEKGIKLDFLSRVHENRAKGRASGAQAHSPNPAFSLASRSIEEQQAALNLSQLSGHGHGVGQLVSALIANAPPAAVSFIAAGDASHLDSGKLTQVDQNALQAMLAQIESMKTRITKLVESSATVPAQEATPQTSQGDDTAMQVD